MSVALTRWRAGVQMHVFSLVSDLEDIERLDLKSCVRETSYLVTCNTLQC